MALFNISNVWQKIIAFLVSLYVHMCGYKPISIITLCLHTNKNGTIKHKDLFVNHSVWRSTVLSLRMLYSRNIGRHCTTVFRNSISTGSSSSRYVVISIYWLWSRSYQCVDVDFSTWRFQVSLFLLKLSSYVTGPNLSLIIPGNQEAPA